MEQQTNFKLGFEYTVEQIRDGEVIASETIHNLMPTEGATYFLSAALLGAAQTSTWYIGLFENDYTPVATDTQALFVGSAYARETTAYTETTRPQWQNDPILNGVLTNTTNKAVFTFNATKTIYGAFLTTASTKGGTTGVLLSAARFLSPKPVQNTDILRVVAGIAIVNV
jgi:hypothetical protein